MYVLNQIYMMLFSEVPEKDEVRLAKKFKSKMRKQDALLAEMIIIENAELDPMQVGSLDWK